MKRHQVIISILFFIIIGLQLFRIYLLSTIDTKNQDYQRMNNQASTIKKQNIVLRDEYLEMTAYTTISTKAHAMGFVNATILNPL